MAVACVVAVHTLTGCDRAGPDGAGGCDPRPAVDMAPPIPATWTVEGDCIACPGADVSEPIEEQWICEWGCGTLAPDPTPARVRVLLCDYGPGWGWDACMAGLLLPSTCL